MSNLAKRFLAITLVVMMLVGAVVTTVSAVIFTDVTDKEDIVKIELLHNLGIVLGTGEDEDGNKLFSPEALVTREQMALFLARIHSATPGAFYKNKDVSIVFTDVTDATYFMAINHCTEQNIIQGRGNNLFDPKAPVTLDEALAMIVRALGYKDLSYPLETTKKAKELGFAMTYKDAEGNKALTRIEVVRLLYTYFYSNEQSLEIVKNENTGLAKTDRISVPVMTKFGIDVQGSTYIVSADDYNAIIDKLVWDPTKEDYITVTLGAELTEKERETSDIILGYVSEIRTYDKTTGILTKFDTKPVYIKLTKEALGIDKDAKGRDLVGLKVVYYNDLLVKTRPEPLGVISYVAGTKTVIDTDDTTNVTKATLKSDYSGLDNDATSLVINGVTIDQRKPADVADSDIYSFGTTTTMKNDVAGTTVLDLAKTINQKGYYTLEFVDNGVDIYDNAEQFYIYTPYRAGYYLKDDSNGYAVMKDNNNERTIGNTTKAKLSIDSKAGGTDVGSLTTGQAYLYTIEGKYLSLFAKLTKVVDNKYPTYASDSVLYIDSKTMSMSKAKTGSMAVYAAQNPRADMKVLVTNSYSVYALTADSTPFFLLYNGAKATIDLAAAKTYGIVKESNAWFNAVIDDFVTRFVIQTTSGEKRINVLGNLEGAYAARTLISYVADGDYFQIAKESEATKYTDPLKPATLGTADKNQLFWLANNYYEKLTASGVAGNKDLSNAALAADTYTYNNVTGTLALSADGTSRITSSTQMFFINSDTKKISAISKATLDTLINSGLEGSADADGERASIEVVRALKAGTSDAKVVVVYGEGAIPSDSRGYVLVTESAERGGDGTVGGYLGKGYNYADGKTYNIVGKSLNVGDVYELLGASEYEDVNIDASTTVRYYKLGTAGKSIKDLTVDNVAACANAGELVTFLTTGTLKGVAVDSINGGAVVAGGSTYLLNSNVDIKWNLATITVYTNLDKVDDKEIKASKDPATWTKDNIAVQMIKTDADKFFPETNADFHAPLKTYYAVVDGAAGAEADMITIIRIVTSDAATK